MNNDLETLVLGIGLTLLAVGLLAHLIDHARRR